MKILKLAISFGFPFLIAALGSFYTMDAIPNWYAGLIKSELNPPNYVFGPVWTILYFLMGWSLYLVWRKTEARKILPIFFAQLVINLFWSITFFGWENPGLALVVIAILIALVLYNFYTFKKYDIWSAYLLMPYLAWITFASYLNYSVWVLNS